MSKFSLNVLERCVQPFIKNEDPDVVLGSVFGEDVALTRIGNGVLVSHVDPIVGAVNEIGWLAVHVACNDIATSGTRPRWIQLLVLVPHKEDESLLKEIMKDASRAAAEIGVTIIGGHTGYSNNLSRPLVAVTALGVLDDQKPVCTRGARPGDHVIITKGIALEGTAILANDFSKAAIKAGVNNREMEDAKGLMKGVSIIPEALVLAKHGATSMHDVSRGGLLETLLEIAKLSEMAIHVEADKIPLLPVVKRFSEAFKFDPLRMISSGTLAVTVPAENVESAISELKAKGILYRDIGLVQDGNGVKINDKGQITHHTEIKCEDDELARMWELYPTDSAN